jgi:hypothetical protein
MPSSRKSRPGWNCSSGPVPAGRANQLVRCGRWPSAAASSVQGSEGRAGPSAVVQAVAPAHPGLFGFLRPGTEGVPVEQRRVGHGLGHGGASTGEHREHELKAAHHVRARRWPGVHQRRDLPWPAATATAMDAFGATVPVEITDGHLRVPVSATPVFVTAGQ